MATTGYVSIGHLIRLMSDENKIQVLRDFCKVLTQEISETCINKDTLIYRFDLFFSNVKPTVESFTKFLTCFIKKPTTEDYFFQFAIENLIWKAYAAYQIKLEISNKNYLIIDWEMFQCFCIFNRFCEPENMLLTENSANFLLKKILQDVEEVEEKIDISAFFKLVFHKDFFLSNHAKIAMKKIFDEFVRDLHHEESQIKIRLRNQVTFSKKTVSITSKYIFITDTVTEEKAFMELIQQDVQKPEVSHAASPTSNSSTSHQQFFAIVLASDLDVTFQKPQQNLFSKKKTTIMTLKNKNEDTLLELCFNSDKDHFRMYQWKRYFEEAIKFNKSKTTRLNEHLAKRFRKNSEQEIQQPHGAEKRPLLKRLQTCLPIMED